MAWEGIVGAVDAARFSKQQIVESEHLMKALLEQKDGLARRIFSKAGVDNTSVLQATDEFISRQLKVLTIRDICLWDTPHSWFGLVNIVSHVFVCGTP
jgi:ATP-dependent Clp protease ATP-binding subunit ClpA